LSLQVELIRLNLKAACPLAGGGVEVRSVDGYQGREKEVVILSLVRSNPSHEVGFLAERRRLNVAVTRARRQVTVIADSETVGGGDAFLRQFLDYLEAHGTLESASLYADQLPEIVRPKDVSLASAAAAADESKAAVAGGGADKKKKKSPTEKVEPKKANVKGGQPVKAKAAAGKIPEPAARAQSDRAVAKPAEATEDMIAELRTQVEAFLAGAEAVFHFTSELTSQQRRIVHELAEELGLGHESLGEGRARHIVISRAAVTAAASENGEREILPQSSKTSSLPVTDRFGSEDQLLLCSRCSKSVSKSNMELHKLRCHIQPVQPTASSSSQKPEVSKKKKSANVLKKIPVPSKNGVEEEDFDAVCAQFQTLNSVCNYERCKTKVTVLGADCAHCRARFCLSHALAEVHGCGEAAKLAARQQLFR
jgi:ATP-dependent RNA/DNA helicase IGHMBP2